MQKPIYTNKCRVYFKTLISYFMILLHKITSQDENKRLYKSI